MISFFNKFLRRNRITGLDFLPTPTVGGVGVDIPDAKFFKSITSEVKNQYAHAFKQTQKYFFFQKAFLFTRGNNIKGDYYEFGVWGARTFRMALSCAHLLNLNDMKFHAFDSFEGLPAPTSKPTTPAWTKGAMKIEIQDFKNIVKKHGLYTDSVHIHPGFYDKILNAEKAAELSNSKAKVINIDCDLYESAVPIFNFIDNIIQEGTILYLDDYFAGYKGNPNKGVALAFSTFQKKSKFSFTFYQNVAHIGRAYIAYPK